MDLIFIRELKLETLIGIYEREKKIPQMIQIDLDIAMRDAKACASDLIDDALDYAKVTVAIKQMLASQHFLLLETLAEHIAQLVLNDFNAPWVKVSVAKLHAIRDCKMVGVVIERQSS